MSMDWVRKHYRVPAKRGGRVLYTGCGRAEYGTIKSAKGGRLIVLLDGHKRAGQFHPTWELSYIASYPTPTEAADHGNA